MVTTLTLTSQLEESGLLTWLCCPQGEQADISG